MNCLASLLILVTLLMTSTLAFPVKDLKASATGYGGYQPQGQVHIHVQRGPTKKHGHDYYAPFSYFVRQPEDTPSHYDNKGY